MVWSRSLHEFLCQRGSSSMHVLQQSAKPQNPRQLSQRQARFVKRAGSDNAHQCAPGEARKPAPDLIVPAAPRLIQPSRRQLMNTASTALMGACACCAGLAQPANAAAKGNWNYLPTYAEQEGGPQKWGGTCVVGLQQSPVDIQYSSMQGGKLMNLAKAPEHRIVPRLPSTPRCQVTNGGHGTMQARSRAPPTPAESQLHPSVPTLTAYNVEVACRS